MNAGLLHLNDQIIALHDGKDCNVSSSGHAIFQQDHIVSGESAQRQFRIKPTLAYTQQWQYLDQQERKLPGTGFRHHADIAFHQIGHWFEGYQRNAPLIVASSMTYSSAQYALLAGLLQAQNIKPSAFIDVGLLQCSGYLAEQTVKSPRFYYLDLSLHNLRLLAMHQRHGQLKLEQYWDFPEFGYLSLHESWLKILAKICIQQTRYDPLHSAPAEQRLYEKITESWISLSNANVMEWDIDGQKIELNQKTLFDAHQPLCTAIAEKTLGAPLLLSHTAALIAGTRGLALTTTHLQQGFENQQQYLQQSTSLKHHTALPMNTANTHALPEKQIPVPVTHLLDQHTALSLASHRVLQSLGDKLCLKESATEECTYLGELSLTTSGCKISSTSTHLLLNGSVIQQPTLLQLGDLISSSSCSNSLTCITLKGDVNGT